MKSMDNLDTMLDDLTVPTGQVRPFFYYEMSVERAESVLQVCFQCLPCGDMLVWKNEVWVCPECEFPLTKNGALALIDDATSALDHVGLALDSDRASAVDAAPKESLLCRLARFFRLRPRRSISERK